MKNLILSLCLTLFFGVGVFGQDYRLVGKFPAPQIRLTAIDGKQVNTQDFRGKIVVYNLWFVGCPPCMEEIPKLNEIVDEFQGKDVVFLGVSSSSKNDIDGFLKKNPFKYQIVPNSAALMLGSFGEVAADGSLKLGFPTHIVVNREGFIEVKASGIKGVEAVRQELRKQFAGK
ncbi:MAG TPA: TlpA disulfide reductase family protein [Pyrinomonadaceae bacterium]|nr:TlpA disulfide reductase family protein [Pyrinomonadaceae bacterium]